MKRILDRSTTRILTAASSLAFSGLLGCGGGETPTSGSASGPVPRSATALAFTTQPSASTGGSAISPAVTVSLVDVNGQLVSNATNAVTITLVAPTGAHLGGTTVATATNGLASFATLSVDKVGTNYQLVASATGFASATSAPFSVSPGPAAASTFSTLPSSVIAGQGASFAVTLTDLGGNVATGASNTVTLGLVPNTGAVGATLSGTLSASAIQGVASFNSVVIDKPGGGYQVTATAAGAGTAVSPAFAVGTPIIPVASLALSSASSMLADVDTMPLTVVAKAANGSVIANPAVAYSTSSAAIATIDSGRVIAHAPGKVTVTASANGVQASITLDVFLGRGVRIQEFSGIDSVVESYMRTYQVPGASVAVMKDGQLLMARAYGYADTLTKRVVVPQNLFRIGSLSKQITGVAALRLVQDGKLALTDRPWAVLSNLPVLNGEHEDPRLVQATLLQTMQQSAGWNTSRDVDYRVWQGTWQDHVFDPDSLFRYGRGIALAANPGTGFSYTNYNAQAVGRLIEKATGQSYEPFVRSAILGPMGITDMQFGNTSLSQRLPTEVRYYDPTYDVDNDAGAMENWDAAGRWLASSVDLMRFVAGIEGLAGHPAVLTPATVIQMTAPPAYAPSASAYYACFWEILKVGSAATWYHGGAPAGAYAYIERRYNGVSYVMLINKAHTTEPYLETDIGNAVDGVKSWPTRNLFPLFP